MSLCFWNPIFKEFPEKRKSTSSEIWLLFSQHNSGVNLGHLNFTAS